MIVAKFIHICSKKGKNQTKHIKNNLKQIIIKKFEKKTS